MVKTKTKYGKEYDVRICDHGDGTFSIVSVFERNENGMGFVPRGKGFILRLFERYYKSVLCD